MLSFFPNLYNYSIFVPVILRIFLGFFFLKIAFQNYQIFKHSKETRLIGWSIIDFIGGIFILAGFLLQPTVLFLALIISLSIYFKKLEITGQKISYDFRALLILILISLALLGPGIWAIDLPL